MEFLTYFGFFHKFLRLKRWIVSPGKRLETVIFVVFGTFKNKYKNKQGKTKNDTFWQILKFIGQYDQNIKMLTKNFI